MRIKTIIYHSVLFSAISLVGVGMIAMSNLTTPLLPDIYDPSRPEDTWSCCMTMVTAHPWRWPLFLVGSGLLLLSATWGVFYLHRSLRQVVKGTSSKKTSKKSWYTILERAMIVAPIGIAVAVLGSIGVRFAITATSSDALFWLMVLHVLITTAWVAILAYGCLLVPSYSIATLTRWQAKQLNGARWRKNQRAVAVLQILALIAFMPLVWLLVYYFIPASHAATSNGRYPLDIVAQLLGGHGNEFYAMTITCGMFIAMATMAAFIHLSGSSRPRTVKKHNSTMPAPTDTPS